MADHLKSVAPIAVIFDTTASEIVSEMYPKWCAPRPSYRGTSLIRNTHPPRIAIGP